MLYLLLFYVCINLRGNDHEEENDVNDTCESKNNKIEKREKYRKRNMENLNRDVFNIYFLMSSFTVNYRL